MVHFNTGPTRWDATGQGKKICFPFLPVRTSVSKAERFFTAGNERTPFNYNNPASSDLSSGTGYHLRKEDKFQYLVELMNMNMDDVVVYITMTYDFLDGLLPNGWKEIKPVWLDANLCGSSEVKPLSEKGSFTIKSQPWAPNFEGQILEGIGHLHDGGVDIELLASGTDTLCKATAKYGESPDYNYSGTSMGGDKVAKTHISSMAGCTNENVKVKELKKGQSWSVKGNYDYAKYEGDLEAGKQSEVSLHFFILFVSSSHIKSLTLHRLWLFLFFWSLFQLEVYLDPHKLQQKFIITLKCENHSEPQQRIFISETIPRGNN